MDMMTAQSRKNNMLTDLLLLSGNDIPFIEAGLVLHQPTIKEIGYIGESCFFTGLEMLNFSKNILPEEDKIHLESQSNFDILIAILREQKNAVMQKNRNCVLMVLALIFPLYSISFSLNAIEFKKDNEEETYYINNSNFDEFQNIISQMFDYEKSEGQDYNPSGDMAKKIADKLKKRHQRLAKAKAKGNENKKLAIFSRYVSILAVGEQKDINSLLNYTVYQLYDEFKRYELKIGYDIYIQAKMAGAKDLKEVDDWMVDIHS